MMINNSKINNIVRESQSIHRFNRDVINLCTGIPDEVLLNPRVFLNLVLKECEIACNEVANNKSNNNKIQIITSSAVKKCIENIYERFK